MTMKTLALAMAVLCVSSLALAQDDKEPPKWSYIEAGYTDFDPDAGLSDDGWYAGGSAGLFKMFHIVAEYNDVGDYTFWNAGFGWHGLLGDPADLYATAYWKDVEVDSSNVSDDGYQVSAGVRWKVLKWLELKGQANWADYDKAGDDWSGEAGVLFSIINDKLGFGASYELADKSETLRGFVRWNIGR
jgi:hypothetical protein